MKLHTDLPFIVVLLSFFITLLAVIMHAIFSYLNDKRFKMVCDLYEKQVGALPLATLLLKNSNTLWFISGYTQKMMFIVLPLIFKKNSFLNRQYSNKHYDFINNLPKEIKSWFYAEQIIVAIGMVSACICMFVYYTFWTQN
ncbi:hypothetical protein [Hafnia sp. CBA7124]|jgi:hypothetical protein|uniref:hypothetical protein n=1 Tax=Hafnia sp. CBA7124 TaxID=1848580 RepID=UPI000BBB65EF|nr:hypothetical protein [Hafnia sp. CBA7124]